MPSPAANPRVLSGADEMTGLYDVKRLAARLGVKPSTVRTMRSRGQLPPPISSDINRGPVWSRASIEEFFEVDSNRARAEAANPADDLPSVIDLFAGCGGLSLGFERAGFRLLAGFDNWQPALDIYNANLSHPAFALDLGDTRTAVQVLKPWMREADIIIGGPPCQDFSSAGKRIEADRADLTIKFARIVTRLKPSAFVMENVERAKDAYVFKKALDTFKRAGYGTTVVVLDASLCGVPQKRKRLFTIGILNDSHDSVKDRLVAGQSKSPMTLREFFGDSLGLEHYYRHPRSYARRGVFSIDEPSPTIRGVNRPVPLGYPGHPGDSAPLSGQLRPLTTGERAQIQTFPADFQFGVGKTDAEQLIGNAVPVELARYVATHLAAHLRDRRNRA